MTSSSADGTRETSMKTLPQLSACLEAAGISVQVPHKRAFVHSHVDPFEAWHPNWQLFRSAHLRAGRLGNGGGGQKKQASLRWLGAHWVNTLTAFPHRQLFKNEKGVSSFIWNQDWEMTLSCPHTIKQPRPQQQGLSHKGDPTDFSVSLSDPESAFPLEHVSMAGISSPLGGGLSNAIHSLCFLQRTHRHTLPCRKRAALLF